MERELHLGDLTGAAAANCLLTDYVTPIFPSTLAGGKESNPYVETVWAGRLPESKVIITAIRTMQRVILEL